MRCGCTIEGTEIGSVVPLLPSDMCTQLTDVAGTTLQYCNDMLQCSATLI